MSNLGFFTISGLACAAHTQQTKKIWQSWLDESKVKATKYGRDAVIRFAKDNGFNPSSNELSENELAKIAFAYLLGQNPGVTKSYILRQAIISYS